MRSILNVRRNSKKEKSSRGQTAKLSPRTAVDKKQRSQSDKPLTTATATATVTVPVVSVEQAFSGPYQERDM